MRRRMATTALAAALVLAGCGEDGGRNADDFTGGSGGDGGGGGAGGAGGGGPIDERIDLTIAEPAEGALLRARRVRVAGAVSGSPSAVRINGANATFADGTFEGFVELEPGAQTITVTADDTTATVNVTIDPIPPRLEISNPARGTHQGDASLALRFHSEDEGGLASLTLNGETLDTGAGPDFEVPVTLRPGLNVLRLEATDAAGNLAREHVSVLHGELRPAEQGVPAALRLHVGPDGLNDVAIAARDRIDMEDLAALLPVEGLQVDGGRFGVTISQVNYDKPSTIELTPDSGQLRFRLRLENVSIGLQLQIGMRPAYAISVGAAAIQATGALVPAIDGEGRIQTDLEDLDLVFEGFAINLGDDAPPEFDDPGAAQSLIEEMLSGGISAFAEQRLPGLLNGFLGKLSEPIDLDLLGVGLRLRLRPDVLVINAAGLSARVDTAVDLVDPPMAPADLAGFVGSVSDWDGVPETTEIGVAIDDDLLNLLVFQIWRSGVLFPTIDQALVDEQGSQLSLVTNILGGLLRKARPEIPATTPIRVDTHLPLPPVAKFVAAQQGAGVEIGVGDMDVVIESDDAAGRALLHGVASLTAHGVAGVREAEGGGAEISVTVGDVIPAFDVTDSDLRGEIEASVEGPILDILGALGGAVGGLLSGIPVPSFQGLTLGNLQLGVTGPNGDFLQATATITGAAAE